MDHTLTQLVEHWYKDERVGLVLELTDYYPVGDDNRQRIIARESGRSTWDGEWLVFPSHPGTPELSEYFTRIKWAEA